MPTYEYKCRKCGEVFSTDLSMGDHDKLSAQSAMSTSVAMSVETEIAAIRCPKCRDIQVEQQLGTFYSKTTRKS